MAHEWMARAACRYVDSELFFPIGTTGSAKPQIEHAKTICGHCLVTDECLSYAIAGGIGDGIYGGLTEDERRGMQRRKYRRQRRTGAYGPGVERGSLVSTERLRADLLGLGLTAAGLNAFAGDGEAVDESTIRDILTERRGSVYGRTYARVATLIDRAKSAVTA